MVGVRFALICPFLELSIGLSACRMILGRFSGVVHHQFIFNSSLVHPEFTIRSSCEGIIRDKRLKEPHKGD